MTVSTTAVSSIMVPPCARTTARRLVPPRMAVARPGGNATIVPIELGRAGDRGSRGHHAGRAGPAAGPRGRRGRGAPRDARLLPRHDAGGTREPGGLPPHDLLPHRAPHAPDRGDRR